MLRPPQLAAPVDRSLAGSPAAACGGALQSLDTWVWWPAEGTDQSFSLFPLPAEGADQAFTPWVMPGDGVDSSVE